MKVIILGLPLFSKRLVKDINGYSGKDEFLFIDTYSSVFAKMKFFFLLPFVDGVLSVNGVTDNSGTLNYVMKWHKKLWMQWVGTDVLLATQRYENNQILRKYVNYAHNVTDAKWLKEELQNIGVSAIENSYKYLDEKKVVLTNYSSIQVLSYIAKNREDFYGLNKIIELAISNPEVSFHIVGTTSYYMDLPHNVFLLGWVSSDEMYQMMSSHPIFLRLTEHDGYSSSVIEAMSLGCEVIASQPFDKAFTSNNENLHDVFKMVINKVKSRGLTPNKENSDYYLGEYNKDMVLGKLYGELKSFYE